MRVLVTGGTGFIGSAVVPELLRHGHQLVGLARSDASADALRTAGVAEVVRGSLDDVDVIAAAAAACDGVVHLAFKHEQMFAGDFPAATAADRRVIAALGAALAGSDRPLVVTTGLAGHAPGSFVTEEDTAETDTVVGERMLAEPMLASFAARGVRTSSLRLSPSVYGAGDPAFVAMLVAAARDKRVSGYIGEGQNHWPTVHRHDAAVLFRLALESAPAGSVLHGVGEEGVTVRSIAEAIARQLGVPAESISPDDAAAHFGPIVGFAALDVRASSALTRERLGWTPRQPGLIELIDQGAYTDRAARAAA